MLVWWMERSRDVSRGWCVYRLKGLSIVTAEFQDLVIGSDLCVDLSVRLMDGKASTFGLAI